MATRSEPPVRQAATPAVAETGTSAPDAGSPPPVGLRAAAAAQAAEAVVLFVAAIFSAVATAKGESYDRASGIALTLIAVGTAAGLGAFAVGLARARPWTRTPVVMTQLFVGGAGIYLVNGHRLEWAIPTLVLAAICLAGVFAPASLRALNRPPPHAPDQAADAQPAAEDTAGDTGTGAPARPAKASQNTKAQQNTNAQQTARTAKAQQSAKTSQNAKRPSANRKRKPRR